MKYKPDYIIIPMSIVDDDKLQPKAKFLYGFLYWFSQLDKGKCVASNSTLAHLTDVSESNIPRILKQLEEEGYISRVYADGDKLARNEIIPLVKFGKVKAFTQEGRDLHTGSAPALPTGLQKKNIKNKIEVYKSIKYLKNLSEEQIAYFTQMFDCKKSDVEACAERIINYCEAHGRKYKNYRAVMRAWLAKDFKKRPKKDYSKL